MMVARGFSSETFVYEAVAARKRNRRTYHVCYLGDFDRAGQDAANSLREKLERFADEEGMDLVFIQIAVTEQQIADWDLPTREPKRKSAADNKWNRSALQSLLSWCRAGRAEFCLRSAALTCPGWHHPWLGRPAHAQSNGWTSRARSLAGYTISTAKIVE
jgi:hypothetical protein